MARVIEDLADTGRGLVENRLRLGVTGLSAAGKTVFVTALVQALQYPANLTGLPAVRDGRFRAALLRPQPSQDLPRFPFEANVARLTGADGAPTWPEGTRRTSELRLSIRYRPAGLAGRVGDRVLHLDLCDYPGEWLLDLALLELDYTTWSEKILQEMRASDSRPAHDYLACIAQLDPDVHDDAAEARAMRAASAFQAYLRACQAATGRARLYHPGRFLMPGDYADSPLLTFAPLPAPAAGRRRPRLGRRPASLRELMRQRYRAYLTTLVGPFQRQHFARLDRQVVLIDLIDHIASGEDALARLGREMDSVQQAMRIGRRWLPVPSASGIDRVLFAASKADQVPSEQHTALQSVLQDTLSASLRRTRFKGATCETMPLAALRATREMRARDRSDRTYVAGYPAGGDTEVAHFPGSLTDDSAAPPGTFAPMSFAPPRGLRPSGPWPHHNLDQALAYLLKGRL